MVQEGARGPTLPPQRRRSIAFTFITRCGFATLTLAHMLDSLVRVSRRVDWNHFANISSTHASPRDRHNARTWTASCCQLLRHRPLALRAKRVLQFPQSRPRRGNGGLNGSFRVIPWLAHLPSALLPQAQLMLTSDPHHTTGTCALHSNMKKSQHWFQAVPFQQFQVLFNSLFKVLFIFPSLYLFAIGLLPIFSFRWNLPPA